MPDLGERIVSAARRLFRSIESGMHWYLSPGQPNAPARTVPEPRVQAVVQRYRQEFDARATDLAERLAKGEIDPSFWRGQMLTEIRYLHLTAAAAAAGGLGMLTASDLALVDRRVLEQGAYLNRWAAQLERQPKESLSAAQIANRARLYGGAATTTASLAIDTVQHRNWPQLPFYPADRTVCRTNCLCDWKWTILDAGRGDADLEWLLDTRGGVEHCRTCLKRRQACRPLRIRNWQLLLPPNMDELLD